MSSDESRFSEKDDIHQQPPLVKEGTYQQPPLVKEIFDELIASGSRDIIVKGGIYQPPPIQEGIYPRPQVVREIYDELMASDTTALVLTGPDGLGKATLADLVLNYAGSGGPGGFEDTVPILISKEIGETGDAGSFRALTMSILHEIDKSDPDLEYLGPRFSNQDEAIGSDKHQVSPAALLYGAIRTAERPIILVLKRMNRFVIEQSGEQILDPEVGEWLRRLNEDNDCKSRVLLTTSIDLTGLIPKKESVISPNLPIRNLDISTRPTTPIGEADISTRPTTPISEADISIRPTTPIGEADVENRPGLLGRFRRKPPPEPIGEAEFPTRPAPTAPNNDDDIDEILSELDSSLGPAALMSNLDISIRPTMPLSGPTGAASPIMPINQTQRRDRLVFYSKPLGVTIDEAVEILKLRGNGWESVPLETLKKVATRYGAEEKRGGTLAHVFKALPVILELDKITPQNLSSKLEDPDFTLPQADTISTLLDNYWRNLSIDQKLALLMLSIYREPVTPKAIRSPSPNGFTTPLEDILPSLTSLYLVEKLSAAKGQQSLKEPQNTSELYRVFPDLKNNVALKSTTRELEQAHANAVDYYDQELTTSPQPDRRTTFQDLSRNFERARHLSKIGQGKRAFEDLRARGVFDDLERMREPERLFEICDEILKGPGLTEADEIILYGLRGRALMAIGRLPAALEDFNQKNKLAAQNQNPLNQAEAHYDLAICYLKGAKPPKSIALPGQPYEPEPTALYLAEKELRQALNIIETSLTEETKFAAQVCELLGDILTEQGKFREAQKYYERALRIYKRSPMKDNQADQARIHCRLGDLCRKQYDREAAIGCYEEAYKLYAQIEDKQDMAYALNKWGKMLCELGYFIDALKKHLEAYNLCAPSDEIGMADSSSYGGDACMLESSKWLKRAKKWLEDAHQCFKEAQELYKNKGIEIGEAESLNNLGRVCDAQANNEKNNPVKLDEALEYYKEALKQAQDPSHQYRRLEGWICSNGSLVHQKKGDSIEAKRWFRLAMIAHYEVGDHEARAITLYFLGQFYKIEAERLPQPGIAQQALFSKAAGYYRKALILLGEQKNWIVGVPAMYERGYIKLQQDSYSSVGVAYLLSAQEYDIKYCGSRYRELIATTIESHKLNLRSKYNEIEASLGSNPYRIVKGDLKG